MKLVMSLVVRDDADVLDRQISYHLNAGVDFVLAADHESRDGSSEILETYAREGHLRRIGVHGERRDAAWRTSMARTAAEELGADWVIDAEPDEFWLPRAESLKDVLVAIPPRYGILQGLVRVFLPRPEDGRSFAERMTVRQAPDRGEDEAVGKLEWALRPLYHARPDVVVGVDRERMFDGRVPLRAWYPVEVLRFPLRSLEQAERRAEGRAGPPEPRSKIELDVLEARQEGRLEDRWAELVVSDDAVERGLADGTLLVDERLRDALRRLEQGGQLEFRAPTVVDDVGYAVECAALREVDFEPLVARISELESRIGSLEARFWPSLRRTIRRVVRR